MGERYELEEPVNPLAASSDPTFDARWAEVEKLIRRMFEADLLMCKQKAQEYGSSDLEIMGKSMETLLPGSAQLDHETRQAAGLEMAIGFYAQGKVSRLFGAWNKGTRPGEDTWRDNNVYSYMARVVRATGRWV